MDEATGLSSFRYFTRRVIEEINSCDRYDQRSFSLLVFELAGLKAFLSRFQEKEIMQQHFRKIAQFFQENIRSTDVVSYLGDESFVILTPEQGEGKAYLIERLKTIFENMRDDLEPQQVGQALSLKIRAADYPGNHEIVQELIREAEEVS